MPEIPIPRRRLLAGTALALTAWMLPRRLAAEETPAPARDGFHILTARPALVALAGPQRPPAAVWGFDGAVPGPLLRVRRGEELKVRLRNELPEPTAIHWHGVRVPNAMDGTALVQRLVPSGERFDYRFSPPDAGTFWYHAPLARQFGRGLCGMLVVEEPGAVDVDREVMLMFDDWRLRADGSIETLGFSEGRETTPAEERVTVNGGPSLQIPVRGNERLRLRMLNASTSRMLAFAFDRHVVSVMALDGQPSEPFTARESRVALGPGNRVDLFLDATLEPGADAAIRVAIEGYTFEPVQFVYETAASLRPAPLPAPKPLPANPLPARIDLAGALRREIRMEQTSAEIRPVRAPLFTVKGNRTVVLALDNRSSAGKAVHVHGHHFRLLDRLDDGWKPFWLDTLLVPPRETWRIAFIADNPGKWMIDMATLNGPSADSGIWFEVT